MERERKDLKSIADVNNNNKYYKCWIPVKLQLNHKFLVSFIIVESDLTGNFVRIIRVNKDPLKTEFDILEFDLNDSIVTSLFELNQKYYKKKTLSVDNWRFYSFEKKGYCRIPGYNIFEILQEFSNPTLQQKEKHSIRKYFELKKLPNIKDEKKEEEKENTKQIDENENDNVEQESKDIVQENGKEEIVETNFNRELVKPEHFDSIPKTICLYNRKKFALNTAFKPYEIVINNEFDNFEDYFKYIFDRRKYSLRKKWDVNSRVSAMEFFRKMQSMDVTGDKKNQKNRHYWYKKFLQQNEWLVSSEKKQEIMTEMELDEYYERLKLKLRDPMRIPVNSWSNIIFDTWFKRKNRSETFHLDPTLLLISRLKTQDNYNQIYFCEFGKEEFAGTGLVIHDNENDAKVLRTQCFWIQSYHLSKIYNPIYYYKVCTFQESCKQIAMAAKLLFFKNYAHEIKLEEEQQEGLGKTCFQYLQERIDDQITAIGIDLKTNWFLEMQDPTGFIEDVLDNIKLILAPFSSKAILNCGMIRSDIPLFDATKPFVFLMDLDELFPKKTKNIHDSQMEADNLEEEFRNLTLSENVELFFPSFTFEQIVGKNFSPKPEKVVNSPSAQPFIQEKNNKQVKIDQSKKRRQLLKTWTKQYKIFIPAEYIYELDLDEEERIEAEQNQVLDSIIEEIQLKNLLNSPVNNFAFPSLV